jgi:hypothetical protein
MRAYSTAVAPVSSRRGEYMRAISGRLMTFLLSGTAKAPAGPGEPTAADALENV